MMSVLAQTAFGFHRVDVPELTPEQRSTLTALLLHGAKPWTELETRYHGTLNIPALRHLIRKGCVVADISAERAAIYRVTKLGEMARQLNGQKAYPARARKRVKP